MSACFKLQQIQHYSQKSLDFVDICGVFFFSFLFCLKGVLFAVL